MLKLKALQSKQSPATEKANPTEEVPTTTNGTTATGDKKTAAQVEEAAKSQGTTSVFSAKSKGANKKKTSRQNAAELRAQKDLSEMPNVPGIEVTFPNPENIMQFNVVISPKDGLYIGAKFQFVVNIPATYPYDPPKVTCETLVYHPNIDWEGHVCLNILRQDWMPVLSLGAVVFGLMTLFLEPNPDDPFNKDAAKLMIEKPSEFQRNVKQSLRGGYVLGRNFPTLIKG